MVGTSGNAEERLSPLTPSARTSPDFDIGAIELRLSNIRSTWPAIRSVVAAEPPRYGTCWICVPVMYLNNSPPTWPGEPLADDALVSLPGLALALATNSFTDLMSDFGDTTSIRCPCTISAIGWRSLSMTYGSLGTMLGLMASAPIGPMPSV